MTEEQRTKLAENPKDFLQSCKYHEQQIKIKLERIRHYRDIAESITAEMKDAPSFGLSPSCKVENCVVEIVTLEEEIQEEVMQLRSDLSAVQEALSFLDGESDCAKMQKLLIEAKYLRYMTWEEIAILLNRSYRWTLRLHEKALKKISRQAMLIHI